MAKNQNQAAKTTDVRLPKGESFKGSLKRVLKIKPTKKAKKK